MGTVKDVLDLSQADFLNLLDSLLADELDLVFTSRSPLWRLDLSYFNGRNLDSMRTVERNQLFHIFITDLLGFLTTKLCFSSRLTSFSWRRCVLN